MKKEKYCRMDQKTREFFQKAGIVVRRDEPVEITDFGLNMVEEIGLQLCVYINTDRVCAKEMVLFSGQTCPSISMLKHGAGRVRKKPSDADTEQFTYMLKAREIKIISLQSFLK